MEGELAAALEPVEVGAELDAVGLETEVGGDLGGGREEPRGADAVVSGKVSGDGDGGVAVDVPGELLGEVSGVREELADAEESVEGPTRFVHLNKIFEKKIRVIVSFLAVANGEANPRNGMDRRKGRDRLDSLEELVQVTQDVAAEKDSWSRISRHGGDVRAGKRDRMR